MIDAYTWFRRAETQFLLKGVSNPTSQAAHVLAAIPDKLFPRISEWLKTKGDAAVEYYALKTYLLKHFTPSPAARLSLLFQLLQQHLGHQKPSDAPLEIKAQARLPSATEGTSRHLDLPRALRFLCLLESIRATIPNAEEIVEDNLQQQADRLLDPLTLQPAASTPCLLTSLHHSRMTKLTSQRSTIYYREPDKHRLNITTPRGHDQTSKGPKKKFPEQLCYSHAKVGLIVRTSHPKCSWQKRVEWPPPS